MSLRCWMDGWMGEIQENGQFMPRVPDNSNIELINSVK